MIVGRTAADLDATCALGSGFRYPAIACGGDVADPATAAAAVRLVQSRGWELGHVVCNAGMGKSGATTEFDPALWRRIFDVNVHGCFHMIHACLPGMVARGTGTITIISSLAGVAAVAYDAAYTASKHALVGFVREQKQLVPRRRLSDRADVHPACGHRLELHLRLYPIKVPCFAGKARSAPRSRWMVLPLTSPWCRRRPRSRDGRRRSRPSRGGPR